MKIGLVEAAYESLSDNQAVAADKVMLGTHRISREMLGEIRDVI
ncbi:MAG: hypothetical protein ACRDWX_06230 [Acidimicrobiia bacterium]